MYARSLTGAGFTIVETLIVLAISGLMLALAISSVDGKQQQTEFNTGVDTLRSDLDQQLSSVSDGNYLPLGEANCTTNGGTTPVFGGAAADGSCTVVGEILAFTTNTTPETFTVLPVIGRNYEVGSSTTLATNITQAIPQISTSYKETTTMPFALTLDNGYGRMIISPGGLGALGLFSFTSFEGGAGISGGSLNSGSSHVELFAIPGSTATETMTALASAVNGNGSQGGGLINCGVNNVDVCIGGNSQAINPSNGVDFCVDSGQDHFSAQFTLGGSNSPDSVTDTIYSSLGC